MVGLMNGKVCMVTGANVGIGYATAMGLAAQGAAVVMVARSRERGEAARNAIIQKTGNSDVHLILADLSSIRQTKRAAAEFQNGFDRLDVLVNNAAIVMPKRVVTDEGLETQFATNHMAYFLFGTLLLPMLQASAPARIINVSSSLHREGVIEFDNLQGEKHYDAGFGGAGWGQYAHTKLMNVLFTYELARRLPDARVTVNALHPGLIGTNLTSRSMPPLVHRVFKLIAPKPERGARTSLHLAASPEAAGITGKYWENCQQAESSPASHDAATAARLWDVSERIAVGEGQPHPQPSLPELRGRH